MKNFYKLRNWITDADSEFYRMCTENDKLEFEFLGYDGNEYFFETPGFPKDSLTFNFYGQDKIDVIVSTECSFFKSGYQITSNVLSLEFIESSLVEIKTDRFSFSMFRDVA